MAVLGIGFAVVFVVALLAWLVQFSDLVVQYRGLGHSWLHALRLAQADIEDERVKRQQKTNPYYRGQPSRFAATPAEREAWAQDLEQKRRALS
jgi:hypothetical protein